MCVWKLLDILKCSICKLHNLRWHKTRGSHCLNISRLFLKSLLHENNLWMRNRSVENYGCALSFVCVCVCLSICVSCLCLCVYVCMHLRVCVRACAHVCLLHWKRLKVLPRLDLKGLVEPDIAQFNSVLNQNT